MDLDGHCRVGALQVRTAHDDGIDLAGRTAGLCQCFENGWQRHLGLYPELVVAPEFHMGAEALRVEHTFLVDHITTLDTRGFQDELLVGHGASRQLAALDGIGVLGVPHFGRLGERGHEFGIADGVRGSEQPGTADHDSAHAGQVICSPHHSEPEYYRRWPARVQPGDRRGWAVRLDEEAETPSGCSPFAPIPSCRNGDHPGVYVHTPASSWR